MFLPILSGLELTWPCVPEVLAGCGQAGGLGGLSLLPLGIWTVWCPRFSFLCHVDAGFACVSWKGAERRISEHRALGCGGASEKGPRAIVQHPWE